MEWGGALFSPPYLFFPLISMLFYFSFMPERSFIPSLPLLSPFSLALYPSLSFPFPSFPSLPCLLSLPSPALPFLYPKESEQLSCHNGYSNHHAAVEPHATYVTLLLFRMGATSPRLSLPWDVGIIIPCYCIHFVIIVESWVLGLLPRAYFFSFSAHSNHFLSFLLSEMPHSHPGWEKSPSRSGENLGLTWRPDSGERTLPFQDVHFT